MQAPSQNDVVAKRGLAIFQELVESFHASTRKARKQQEKDKRDCQQNMIDHLQKFSRSLLCQIEELAGQVDGEANTLTDKWDGAPEHWCEQYARDDERAKAYKDVANRFMDILERPVVK